MTDADKTAALKTDFYKKAHSALLLCLKKTLLRVFGKKLSEHIDEFNKLVGDLANIDVDIDDKDQALMLLTSLPSSYDNFVETLLYGRESLTLEDVLSSLNSRELKKRTYAKDNGDGLYVRGRSDHRGNQGRGSSRSKSKGKGTHKLKCYICYSEDHLKKDCPKGNKKKSTGFFKKNVRQGSSMHYDNENGYSQKDEKQTKNDKTEHGMEKCEKTKPNQERFLEWIIDSGGSFHMTPRRDFLFDFKEFNGGTVLLGDNRACAFMGIGKVRVQMKDGSSFVLENVRYIPELKRNLISLGTLDREGYTVKLQNGRVKVIKGSLMVLSGTMNGNYVYSLDGWAESSEASVGIQEKESLAQVWHKCLGHISEAGLHELEKREVLRKKGLGSFSGEIDEWLPFKEWKKLVENQTGRKLKKLRTDNGLEFCNQEFNNLYKESGIARHLTVAGTLQQDGLAERMNMTLLNKVRCLLIQSGLPDSFWAEATVTTAYLINRSPSTTLEKKTPMDLWLGHPANYEILRILGCVAYSHMNQGKLKPRAIKCIFLGDVVFNESLMYKDTLKGDGAADSGKEVKFEVELQGTIRITTIPASYRDEGNVSLSRPSGSKVDDMAAYAFAIAEEEDTHEPITFQEAINSSEKDEWVRAMEEDMTSLKKNHTWELVDQPPGQKLRAGIDYNKVFSHVVRHTSIRVILLLTACEDYELEQIDVKTVFLHGNLDETIYMRQPPGFEEGTGNKHKVSTAGTYYCLCSVSAAGYEDTTVEYLQLLDG
ncbi:retrovirus-related pol polyprotein from transposon TNT 1-94 [Tanacetum coccineum]